MTEDMLEEQAEILTQLGTSVEGARVRAQMQCASLLSDMEAFKVRNCGSPTVCYRREAFRLTVVKPEPKSTQQPIRGKGNMIRSQ